MSPDYNGTNIMFTPMQNFDSTPPKPHFGACSLFPVSRIFEDFMFRNYGTGRSMIHSHQTLPVTALFDRTLFPFVLNFLPCTLLGRLLLISHTSVAATLTISPVETIAM